MRGWRGAARELFFHTASTVVGLIRNTQAVSRMPLPVTAVDPLATDLGCSAAILIPQENDPPCVLPVLTLRAWGPVSLLAHPADRRLLTVGTRGGNGGYPLPPPTMLRQGEDRRKLLICHIPKKKSHYFDTTVKTSSFSAVGAVVGRYLLGNKYQFLSFSRYL
jgi:hypothetical protein